MFVFDLIRTNCTAETIWIRTTLGNTTRKVPIGYCTQDSFKSESLH